MSAGKGDSPRPVDIAKYGANYDFAFRKKARPRERKTKKGKK